MSIYDEIIEHKRSSPKVSVPKVRLPPLPKPKTIILGLIFLTLIIALSYSYLTYVPKEINVSSLDKYYSLSNDTETFLQIEVVNNSLDLEKEAIVEIRPYSDDFFIIYPKTGEIKAIASGEKRYLDFVIRPKPSVNLAQGTYSFKAEVIFDDRRDSIDFEIIVKE